jgi:hypothetical protein
MSQIMIRVPVCNRAGCANMRCRIPRSSNFFDQCGNKCRQIMRNYNSIQQIGVTKLVKACACYPKCNNPTARQNGSSNHYSHCGQTCRTGRCGH